MRTTPRCKHEHRMIVDGECGDCLRDERNALRAKLDAATVWADAVKRALSVARTRFAWTHDFKCPAGRFQNPPATCSCGTQAALEALDAATIVDPTPGVALLQAAREWGAAWGLKTDEAVAAALLAAHAGRGENP